MHCLRSLVYQLGRRPIRNKSMFFCYNKKNVQESSRYYGTEIKIEDESDTIVRELCKGNDNLEKKLKVLMLEVEVMRQDGRCAPDNIHSDQWERLLEMPSRKQRTNYLTFLWKIEKKKENEKSRKEARRKELVESPPEYIKEFPDDVLYGIKHQSMFLRIRDQSINMFDNYRRGKSSWTSLWIVPDSYRLKTPPAF
ncbi:jg7535 [Pararge aegeria aegeria]|uniref:Jg7535 protein n=1 Tax=Pararge aegeria aegeria TaxID=348720 RepID=A0A8S4QKN8_9NEOP|nr:jg7535 [Pararge aegeria aegeria]